MNETVMENAIDDGEAFSPDSIGEEIRRRRRAGELTLANATSAELMLLDQLLSLRQILGAFVQLADAASKMGTTGIGGLLGKRK